MEKFKSFTWSGVHCLRHVQQIWWRNGFSMVWSFSFWALWKKWPRETILYLLLSAMSNSSHRSCWWITNNIASAIELSELKYLTSIYIIRKTVYVMFLENKRNDWTNKADNGTKVFHIGWYQHIPNIISGIEVAIQYRTYNICPIFQNCWYFMIYPILP